MGLLYNGYCFESANDIANVLQTAPLMPGSTGVFFINSCSVSNSTITCTLWQKTNSITNQAGTVGTIARTFPTCPTVGYMPPSNSIEMFANQYLAFDATIFGIIIGSSLVALALGYSTGAIIQLMRRT